MLYTTIIIGLGLASYAQAHGNHEQQPIASDWASQHMADEHHISSYDAGSFFKLHDYDDSNEWTMEDIIKTYGGRDESTRHISQEDKDKAAKEVISLFDRDLSGTVSFAEFVTGDASGIKLPSISWATGHHGDDEFEYETHHFEKYHDENTKEEDLIHPEDIEHFRKHEEMERQQEAQERMDRMSIVEANIPRKFRRG